MTGRLTRGVMWDIKTSHYLKKRPGRAFPFFLAGWASLLWGDMARAGQYFDSALAVDAGYAPACIGKICREIRLGRYGKAASLLMRYADGLGLNGIPGQFRLGSAMSMCAPERAGAAGGIAGAGHADDAIGGAGANGVAVVSEFVGAIGGAGAGAEDFGDGGRRPGLFSAARYFAVDLFGRRYWTRHSSPPGTALSVYLKLIRYIELIKRPEGSNSAEKKALAADIYVLPGLADEFRLRVLSDLGRGPERLEFTFDNPAIFTKPLLNAIFWEKIMSGDLRAPRIILSNLRRDAMGGGIVNTNKWLFLKLCHNARRCGELESATAKELESEGWWADPIVRAYLSE